MLTPVFTVEQVESAIQTPDTAEEGHLSKEVEKFSVENNVTELGCLYERGADIRYQDDKTGVSALISAAKAASLDALKFLLLHGAPWNALDKDGKSAGDHASTEEVQNLLLDWGVLCEQIMSREPQTHVQQDSEVYLSGSVTYQEGNLIDKNGEAVMMEWEKPLMLAHANLLCQARGDVLNVGFGLGLIDQAIQECASLKYNPRSHTIIEAHPDVYKYMIEQGWDKKPNVKILFGRWQDVAHELTQYDGIFFDTFAEHYEHMRSFHELLLKILKRGGIYSFFNGLAPRAPFFAKVYRHVVNRELASHGITVEYMELPVDVNNQKWDAQWKRIKNRYWHQGSYYLPIAYWTDDD